MGFRVIADGPGVAPDGTSFEAEDPAAALVLVENARGLFPQAGVRVLDGDGREVTEAELTRMAADGDRAATRGSGG